MNLFNNANYETHINEIEDIFQVKLHLSIFQRTCRGLTLQNPSSLC